MLRTLKIDLVTDDASSGELVVYLVEDGPWPTPPLDMITVPKRIQGRIFDAIDAAIDGYIAAEFPDSIGKNIRVQIDSPSGCPEQLQDLVNAVHRFVGEDVQYATTLKQSNYVKGIRIVTGKDMGRFNKQR
jgi:hypothetical protein